MNKIAKGSFIKFLEIDFVSYTLEIVWLNICNVILWIDKEKFRVYCTILFIQT